MANLLNRYDELELPLLTRDGYLSEARRYHEALISGQDPNSSYDYMTAYLRQARAQPEEIGSSWDELGDQLYLARLSWMRKLYEELKVGDNPDVVKGIYKLFSRTGTDYTAFEPSDGRHYLYHSKYDVVREEFLGYERAAYRRRAEKNLLRLQLEKAPELYQAIKYDLQVIGAEANILMPGKSVSEAEAKLKEFHKEALQSIGVIGPSGGVGIGASASRDVRNAKARKSEPVEPDPAS